MINDDKCLLYQSVIYSWGGTFPNPPEIEPLKSPEICAFRFLLRWMSRCESIWRCRILNFPAVNSCFGSTSGFNLYNFQQKTFNQIIFLQSCHFSPLNLHFSASPSHQPSKNAGEVAALRDRAGCVSTRPAGPSVVATSSDLPGVWRCRWPRRRCGPVPTSHVRNNELDDYMYYMMPYHVTSHKS